jgi:hypothetical protein
MCVNGNNLAKSLTSQNQQTKHNDQTWNPTPMHVCTHINKQTPDKKKTGRKAKNTTLFQQVLDEQWFWHSEWGDIHKVVKCVNTKP